MSSFELWGCMIVDSSGKPAQGLDDRVSRLLLAQKECPKDVKEFRNLLSVTNASFHTAMVANRGFNNPTLGSFSLFETVTTESSDPQDKEFIREDLYFGHFTATEGRQNLILDQDPLRPGLMVELIAWDETQELYNFYELVGSTAGSKWIFRGDSRDIWADVAELHLSQDSQNPKFGGRLRCSGCHVSGGPIMKELAAPHDSWWSASRPLPLAGHIPDQDLATVMKSLEDSAEFSHSVQNGLQRLFAGRAFKSRQDASLQIALRPLFCPEEVNFESSSLSMFDSLSGSLGVPSSFFLDPRLGTSTQLQIERDVYLNILKRFGSRFPETSLSDADHAWLSPVKAWSDSQAIEALKKRGMLTTEFIISVLGVDRTRPVFSNIRCGLLKHVPKKWSLDWLNQFKANLIRSQSPPALELWESLQSGNSEEILASGQFYLKACQQSLLDQQELPAHISYLDQVRAEIAASPISKNPRGQILEPGFRVIFPEFLKVDSVPWSTTLNNECLPTVQ